MKPTEQKKLNSDLAIALKGGNEGAFELLFRSEYSNLKIFVSRYITDDDVAEDIVQECFMRLWVNRKRINPKLNLKSYLYTIARNGAISEIRKINYRKPNSLATKELKLRMDLLQDDYIISQIDAKGLNLLIEQTYDSLPKKLKEPFLLSRKEGLTYREIAKKLDISVKSVEHSISATLKIFRENVSSYTKLILWLLTILTHLY